MYKCCRSPNPNVEKSILSLLIYVQINEKVVLQVVSNEYVCCNVAQQVPEMTSMRYLFNAVSTEKCNRYKRLKLAQQVY